MALESGFSSTLSTGIGTADTTIYVAALPLSTTSGICLIGEKDAKEWISFTGVASSPNRLTGVTRGLDKDATSTTDNGGADQPALSHVAGTRIRLVASHLDIFDKDGNNTVSGNNTYTGTQTFSSTTKATDIAQSVTTAQRDALTGVVNGARVYNTTTGQMNWYEGGTWVANAAGGTVADASTTVAGKVEIADSTESNAGDDSGATGAPTVMPPSQTARVIQDAKYIFAADAGASDDYAITITPAPTAYATGQGFYFSANTANTGAATLNVNSLGAKTIKKYHNEDLATNDIESGGIYHVIYDGTNFQLQTGVGVNMSEANTFFGATDITGAEAETLTLGNTSNAVNLHGHPFTIGNGTASSTGTQVIAHGLGATPRLIVIHAVATWGTNSCSSNGQYTAAAGNQSVYSGNQGVTNGGFNTTIISLQDAGNSITATAGSLDATNFTLSFTESATASCAFTWIAYA